MTRWLFLLVELGTIVFTIGFIQDEEDRQGIGSSRLPRLRRWLPNHELHDLDNDNRDAGLSSESEPRRTPRQAPPPPPSNTPTPPPPVACSADQFQCLTGNQCIQRAYKCDGIPDCNDGSDEREQECLLQPCPLSNQFQCTSGDCIALDGRCDGKVDCMDKSDEVGCPSVEMQCSEDQFMCSDGSCIEKDWLCDLVTDCLDGDDEAQCCMTNEFTCGDGSCIPEYFRCDNKFDCTDGSDERNDCENKRSVELGLSVKMECHQSLPGPVSYTWSKKDGDLPANVHAQNAVLDISEVQAADAGVYVCTSRNTEQAVHLATLLTVTGVVPRFNESSYLALQTLPRAYLMFDIEISFKPESPDGLILYNSKRAGPDGGDFVAFGLVGGYPEFRFDIGAGPAVIRGTQPMEMNQWHTVNLSRDKKEGRMRVNGGEPLAGASQGRYVGLELVEPLYLGGFPDFQNVHRQTGMTTGFEGCISRLTGNTLNAEFVLNANERVGITSCETCATNPCQNNGVCQEAYNERGHKCFCPAGYLGELCSRESCYEGVCGTGRCIDKPDGFKCYCPFGKTGDRCNQDIHIYELAFGDESYIAFPTPIGRQKLVVEMYFKPESLDDGILMYCAQRESGSGDFASLSIHNTRLEFRFNTGSGLANIQSDPISEGEWIKVRVNRTGKMGSLSVNDGPMVNGESPGRDMGVNLQTPLFIGGIDNFRIQVSPDVGVKDGFRGCVSKIKVMDQEVLLGEAVVESTNVDQCGDAASSCSRSPCQNNAACVEDPASHNGYVCHCPEGYSGENCQHAPDVCTITQPCKNGGSCISQGHDSTCLCPLGHAGKHCEHTVHNIRGSAAFSGNSWVELNHNLLPQETDVLQIISFEFKTHQPNALLFWYGQHPSVTGQGQGYISIAIKNGYVEFSYDLGDGPADLHSQSRVDDGQFHSLLVERGGKWGFLTFDLEIAQATQSPGQLHTLNADGNIYIGGVPDFALMTGGTHTSGFVGCIRRLLIGSTKIDNFLNSAISGVNLIPCHRRRRHRKPPQST